MSAAIRLAAAIACMGVTRLVRPGVAVSVLAMPLAPGEQIRRWVVDLDHLRHAPLLELLAGSTYSELATAEH